MTYEKYSDKKIEEEKFTKWLTSIWKTYGL